MNKKVNTILFVLAATVFNIITAMICFVSLLLLYIKFIFPLLPDFNHSWVFTLIFIAAIAVSILVYRVLLKFLLTKVTVEKYFDPLFTRKYVKKDPNP